MTSARATTPASASGMLLARPQPRGPSSVSWTRTTTASHCLIKGRNIWRSAREVGVWSFPRVGPARPLCGFMIGTERSTRSGTRFRPFSFRLIELGFSPDGAMLAADGMDRHDPETLGLWHAGKTEANALSDFHPEAGASVAFSPDGKARGRSRAKGLFVYDIASGKKVYSWETEADPCCVALCRTAVTWRPGTSTARSTSSASPKRSRKTLHDAEAAGGGRKPSPPAQ